jgi:hypothetical protein
VTVEVSGWDEHNVPGIELCTSVKPYRGDKICTLILCNLLTIILPLVLIAISEMGGACSMFGDSRDVHRVLVGKPEGNKSLGRPRRRWEDNMKMDIQEVGCGGME